jgi:hypothetical protein
MCPNVQKEARCVGTLNKLKFQTTSWIEVIEKITALRNHIISNP